MKHLTVGGLLLTAAYNGIMAHDIKTSIDAGQFFWRTRVGYFVTDTEFSAAYAYYRIVDAFGQKQPSRDVMEAFLALLSIDVEKAYAYSDQA